MKGRSKKNVQLATRMTRSLPAHGKKGLNFEFIHREYREGKKKGPEKRTKSQ